MLSLGGRMRGGAAQRCHGPGSRRRGPGALIAALLSSQLRMTAPERGRGRAPERPAHGTAQPGPLCW